MSSLSGSYGLGLILEAKNKISPVLKQVRGDFKRFTVSQENNLLKMRTWSNRVGREFSQLRSGMIKSVQFMGVGAAIAAPFVILGKAAADSEMRLANVKSLLVTEMGAPEVERNMFRIRDAIFKTGRVSMIPLSQMETAFYDLKSANLTVDEAIGALPATAKLAVAGLGTMDEAVKYQTGILNTYGVAWGDTMTPMEKAEKISNITANTIAAFKTTLPDLSQALQYCVGPANALGVEFSELTSTVGALQTAGMQGTLAGTALNAFYRSATRLVSQTGEEYDGASLSAEEYFNLQQEGAKATTKSSLANLQLIDSTGKLKPLPDILEAIEKRFGLNADAAKELAKQGISVEDGMVKMGISAKEAGALQKAFGDEGSRAVMMLLGQSDALREKIKVTAESNNLDKMVEARQDTLIGKLQMTKNRLRELVITSGTGLLDGVDFTKINETIEGIIAHIAENPEIMQSLGKVAGTLAGGAASIGIGLAVTSVMKMLAKHPVIAGLTVGAFGGKYVYDNFLRGVLPGSRPDYDKQLNEFLVGQEKVLHPENYSQLLDRIAGMNAEEALMSVGMLGSKEAGGKKLMSEEEKYRKDNYLGTWGLARMGWDKLIKPAGNAVINAPEGAFNFVTGKDRSIGLGVDEWLAGESGKITTQEEARRRLELAGGSSQPITVDPGLIGRLKNLPTNTVGEGETTINKNITLDVNLHGDNLKYDVDTLYNGLKNKLQSEQLLSEEGKM